MEIYDDQRWCVGKSERRAFLSQNEQTRVKEPVTLEERVSQIHGREDFVRFVQTLSYDLHERPASWENGDLASFLEAMAAWVGDMDGYYRNRGEIPPDQPSWRTMAQSLLAAKVYE